MTITSIGSSFSYIRPDRAAGNAAPAATEETTESPANAASDSDDRSPSAASPSAAAPERSKRPSVADEMQAILVKAQETHRSAPSAVSAARAYAGH